MSSNAKSFAAFNGIRSARRKQLTEAPEGLPTSFFGFNSNSKISGLFDFVFVVLQRDTASGCVCSGIGDAAAFVELCPAGFRLVPVLLANLRNAGQFPCENHRHHTVQTRFT
ncbi:hypothetical protein [Rathayibacter toxicus]|nr:hypothetical protein [Rathayibacter toxicus]QWL35078.1 hypothetical protein E2R36_09225 [Rathayibacter toxicus]